jgi:hypothetical protein
VGDKFAVIRQPAVNKASIHMKNLKVLVGVVAGVLAGVAFAMSCGDGTSPADAAVCDCPVAEAPIASRIVEVENTVTLSPANMAPANGRGGQGVVCPDGATLMTGGCAANAGQVPDISLEQSFPGMRSWQCSWRNNTNTSVVVRVIARCLVPAS